MRPVLSAFKVPKESPRSKMPSNTLDTKTPPKVLTHKETLSEGKLDPVHFSFFRVFIDFICSFHLFHFVSCYNFLFSSFRISNFSVFLLLFAIFSPPPIFFNVSMLQCFNFSIFQFFNFRLRQLKTPAGCAPASL